MNPRQRLQVQQSMRRWIGALQTQRARNVMIGVTLLGALAYPLIIGDNEYLVHIGIMTLFWGYLAVAWNLLFGQAGQLSFGHGMFYGLGAYGTAYMLQRFDLPPLIGAPVGVGLAVVAALIVGYVTFRYGLKGLHFALFTFFGAEMLRLLILNATEEGPTGMIMRIHADSLTYLQFETKLPYYYIILGMVITILLVGYRLADSRVGHYWRAIREDEEAAESLGINAFKYKMYAIVVSAAFTGLGGVFTWQYHAFIEPRQAFGMDVTIEMLVRGVVGGLGSIFGAIAASVLITPIIEVLQATFGTSRGLHIILFGVVLIGMGFWLVRRRAASGRAARRESGPEPLSDIEPGGDRERRVVKT